MGKTTAEGNSCFILKEDKLVKSSHKHNAGWALTLQMTAVTTHSYFGVTSVRVVIPAVPEVTSALKVSPTLMYTTPRLRATDLTIS